MKLKLNDRVGIACALIAAVLTALSCEHAPAKAGPQLAPLTDVQREWVRDCAKHLEGPDIRGKAALVVGQCRARARILW